MTKLQPITLLRKLAYHLLGMIDRWLNLPWPQVIILAYHGISSDGNKYLVSLSNFKRQINYLSQIFKFISLEQLHKHLLRGTLPKTPSVVITFDDGYQNILQVREYLSKLGVRPTVFTLSKPADVDRIKLESQEPFLQAKDIRLLKKWGWDFGSHSATHADLTKLTQKELDSQIVQGKLPLKYFSYPWGRYNSQVVRTVKKLGYRLAVTMDDSIVDIHTNPFKLARIGVDGTHTFNEFKVLFSPSIIRLRGFIKSFLK